MNQRHQCLINDKSDWVLVQEDTTTTMTASLGAFYQRVKVAHMEAGPRTGEPNRLHSPRQLVVFPASNDEQVQATFLIEVRYGAKCRLDGSSTGRPGARQE